MSIADGVITLAFKTNFTAGGGQLTIENADDILTKAGYKWDGISYTITWGG